MHELMKSVVFPVKKTVEFLESIATGYRLVYLAAARDQLSPAHLGILQSGISPQCTFQISGFLFVGELSKFY